MAEAPELYLLRDKLEGYVEIALRAGSKMAGTPEVKRMGQKTESLKGQMRRKVSILESECSLPAPASGSITISAAGGSIVSVGNITGRSILSALNQIMPFDEALANVLAQLTRSIEKSNEIGEELRQSVLQKLEFVAQQAVAQPGHREQATIIESIWNGLVASLSISADITQICSVAAPLVARHFS